MTRIARVGTVLALMVALTAAFLVTFNSPPAKAVSASLWDPAYIISDSNFFTDDVMTESEIQAFLNAKVPDCREEWSSGPSDPIVCLKDFRMNTIDRAADAYCPGAYNGASNESAARIIYKVQQACNISARVLLITLQKEQGLVTHVWPSQYRYDIAMGYGCPDTGDGCMAEYYGFQNQLWRAARQFQRYRLLPNNYNYRAGVSNIIAYDPNPSCGASRVTIRNSATAALYNYTPYQPNANALANLYGSSSDTCASYGNRNFWRYYWDWFGNPTTQPDLAIADSGNVYLLVDNTRWRIDNPDIIDDLSPLGTPTWMSTTALGGYTHGGVFTGVIDLGSGTYALVDDGVLHPFTSCALATDYGVDCADAIEVTDTQRSSLRTRSPLTPTARLSNGELWHVDDGVARQVLDAASLSAAGLPSAEVSLGADALDSLAVGAPHIRDDVIIGNADDGTHLVDNGGSLYSVDATLSSDLGLASARAGTLTPESLAHLPAPDGALSPAVVVSGEHALLGQSRRYPVDAGLIDSSVTPVALTAQIAALFPVATDIDDGTVVRFGASGERYGLVESGQMRVAPTGADFSEAGFAGLGSALVVPESTEDVVREGMPIFARSSSYSTS